MLIRGRHRTFDIPAFDTATWFSSSKLSKKVSKYSESAPYSVCWMESDAASNGAHAMSLLLVNLLNMIDNFNMAL